MPKAQTFSNIIFILIVLQLAGLIMLAKYLEKTHPECWDKLGRFSVLNWGIANSTRFGWTVLFRNSLASLNDRNVTAFIWAQRAMSAGTFTAVAVWGVVYGGGHPTY